MLMYGLYSGSASSASRAVTTPCNRTSSVGNLMVPRVPFTLIVPLIVVGMFEFSLPADVSPHAKLQALVACVARQRQLGKGDAMTPWSVSSLSPRPPTALFAEEQMVHESITYRSPRSPWTASRSGCAP